jgi:hypothetical protein
MVGKEELKMGVYPMIDSRRNSLLKYVGLSWPECYDSIVFSNRLDHGIRYYLRLLSKVPMHFFMIPLVIGAMMIYRAVRPM